MGGGVVSPGNAFGMDTHAVVVASVVCEAKQVDLQISGRQAFVVSLGRNPGKPFRSREIYPRPDDIMGIPDCLDIGFERPSPGSDDVDQKPREILPVYSIPRLLLGKDVLFHCGCGSQ